MRLPVCLLAITYYNFLATWQTCYVRLYWLKINIAKAANKNSKLRSGAKRESGKLGTDASAGVEWTWELQTENFLSVGFVAREALSSPGVSSFKLYTYEIASTWSLSAKKGGTAEVNLLPLWAEGFSFKEVAKDVPVTL